MKDKKKVLLTIMMLIYIAFGLVTSVIGVIIDKFQLEYNVSLQIAAFLPFAFYIAYGLFSIPFGLQMDKISAKSVLFTGLILLTAGCLILFSSNNYKVIIAMIFLIGIGVTALQTAGNPFIRELDTPAKYSANLTIIIGIGGLGYAFSPLIVPVIQGAHFSWNLVYLIFGIFSLILLLLLTLIKFPGVNVTEEEKIQTSTIPSLLKNKIIITYTLGIFLYVGGEVGTSSYIVLFLSKIHKIAADYSLWNKDSFWYLIFPSLSALIVGLFWLFQAFGRLIMGWLMKYFRPKTIFVTHSAGTCIALLFAVFGSKQESLIAFVLVGYFTSVSFTSIFSGAIQSFNKYQGTISGILCTAIAGGALLGYLVGFIGGSINLKAGMMLNFAAFFYVFILAVFGRGNVNGDLKPEQL
jgi:FHS family L-fucose permease-like MFS transporter